MDTSLSKFNTTDTFDSIRMYVMDFYVFHFYNSKFITIQCTIKICGPDNEESCEWVSCIFKNLNKEPTFPSSQPLIKGVFNFLQLTSDILLRIEHLKGKRVKSLIRCRKMRHRTRFFSVCICVIYEMSFDGALLTVYLYMLLPYCYFSKSWYLS